MAAEKQQTSIFEFSYKSVNTSLEKLIKIKVIFILRQGMLKNTKSLKYVTLVTPLSRNDREPFRTKVFFMNKGV